MAKTPKPKKPTLFQARILAAIAHSPLMREFNSDRKIIYKLVNGREISEKCARALIENGWVVPQRDGLGLYDDTQTWRARVPS